MDYKIISFNEMFNHNINIKMMILNALNLIKKNKLEVSNAYYEHFSSTIAFVGNSENHNDVKQTLIHELYHHYSTMFIKDFALQMTPDDHEYIVELMSNPTLRKINNKLIMFLRKFLNLI